MKRIISILLVCVILLAVLVSCGPSNKKAESEEAIEFKETLWGHNWYAFFVEQNGEIVDENFINPIEELEYYEFGIDNGIYRCFDNTSTLVGTYTFSEDGLSINAKWGLNGQAKVISMQIDYSYQYGDSEKKMPVLYAIYPNGIYEYYADYDTFVSNYGQYKSVIE